MSSADREPAPDSFSAGNASAEPPPRTYRLLLWGSVALASSVFIFYLRSFLPGENGKVGHDYVYYLPQALAGYYWQTENGALTLARFTPAFCGGLPFLYSPQNSYLSLHQYLTNFVDPLRSFLFAALSFGLLGGIATGVLARRRFAMSMPAACLATVIFLLNGFFMYRMAIGHALFYCMALTPLLALAAIRPDADFGASASGRWTAILARASILALGFAVAFHAGAIIILLPMLLAVLVLRYLHVLWRAPSPDFWTILTVGGVLTLGLCAFRLVPAMIFAGHFPRPAPFVLEPSLWQLLATENMHRLDRFWMAYIPFLAILAGLCLDAALRAAGARHVVAGFAILLTAAQLLASDRRFYDAQPYDPSRVREAWREVRATGAPPPVDRLVELGGMSEPGGTGAGLGFIARNDGLTEGVSAIDCYEPIFGYRLETFPEGLRPGPTLEAVDGRLNIRNPACFVFGEANDCRPGDTFAADQRAAAADFLAYRPFAFRTPWWQHGLGWLALVTLAVCLGAASWAGWRSLVGWVHRSPERRPVD